MRNYLLYFWSISLVLTLAIFTGCETKMSESPPESLPKTLAPILDEDGWITKNSYYEKTVHYGTTRVDKCSRKILSVSGDIEYIIDEKCAKDLLRLNTGNKQGEQSIHYGRAVVKIPYTKVVGGTAGMSLTYLRHNVGWENFISQLSSDDLLIFIHGFNTSFSNAAIRCAQLAHDTNFNGEAVFYSWPSAENPATYARDKKRAQENFELFASFLQDIASNTDKKIHVIAHSMGTYILMNSLAILNKRIESNTDLLHSRRKKHDGKIFSQIILAAPDIAKDDYHRKFSNHNFSNMADKITLYSAENDHVLDAAQIMNYFVEGTSQARLGDSSGSFFVIKGMDTIDTRQEISPQFFGHSFYANYRSMVSDMYILLNYGTSPDKRMLQKVVDKNGDYLWFIRD